MPHVNPLCSINSAVQPWRCWLFHHSVSIAWLPFRQFCKKDGVRKIYCTPKAARTTREGQFPYKAPLSARLDTTKDRNPQQKLGENVEGQTKRVTWSLARVLLRFTHHTACSDLGRVDPTNESNSWPIYMCSTLVNPALVWDGTSSKSNNNTLM